ncbi:hypothetical protein J6590_084488 [Homalodisca vitripennis]|nr:hypothetical protein J6590_084488 [Homalodisca vitripennis]
MGHLQQSPSASLCSDKDGLKEEFKKVESGLRSNGYPQLVINKCKRTRRIIPESEKHNCDKFAFMSIPYVPGLSEKIRRVDRKYNIRTAFKTHNTLRQSLGINRRDKKTTKRKDKRAQRRHEKGSHRKTIHHMNWDEGNIIHREPHFFKRKLIETTYIKLADQPISQPSERELERQQREEEMSLMQRSKEAAQFQEWERQEDQFHLEQARLRSRIRIQDGRAKPIDLLAKYISAEEDVDAVEMHEPYTYLNGLMVKDLEDLIEDIKVYIELEKGKNLDYWNDITVIVEDELHKLRKLEKQTEYEVAVGRREGIHQCVAQDVAAVFKGKTASQLQALQSQIENKILDKTQGVDIGYWESLLSQLKAHMARARLRDRHQDNLRRKLELLKAEQGVEEEEGSEGEGAAEGTTLSADEAPEKPEEKEESEGSE